ncbi:MAG: hypothetical protein KC636_08730 [Myxococcales bacterium]|nr:hypothetical protein [Myxococcales bacterium]
MSVTQREEHDLILNLIRRFAEALAALVNRESITSEAAALAEASDELERVFEEEFGELHRRLVGVDASSAAAMLRPLPRLRAYVLLLGYRTLARAREEPPPPERAREATRALELALLCRVGLLEVDASVEELDRVVRALASLPCVDTSRLPKPLADALPSSPP